MADRIKIILALLVVAGGVVAFYIFSDQSLLVRVIGLLVVVAISVSIVMTAEVGKQSWAFLQDARTEVRKVVWPTRQELMQTTMIVVVFVLITALILWGIDSLIGWIVSLVIG